MSRKIKLHSLHFLFHIFSFLADKSGGWKLFVKPKLIIGSLILGLGITACGTKTSNTNDNASTNNVDSIQSLTKSYESVSEKISDSVIKPSRNKKIKLSEPRTTSYDTHPIENENQSAKPDTFSKKKSKQTNDVFIQDDGIVTCYAVVEIPQKPNTIYEVVEQMPEFPGGKEALFKYISSELKYPNNEFNIQGRVICRFVVEKDGCIDSVKIVRSLEPSYDKEVVRLIQNMPKWIPGKQNGKVVRVWYTLPVSFKLQ